MIQEHVAAYVLSCIFTACNQSPRGTNEVFHPTKKPKKPHSGSFARAMQRTLYRLQCWWRFRNCMKCASMCHWHCNGTCASQTSGDSHVWYDTCLQQQLPLHPYQSIQEIHESLNGLLAQLESWDKLPICYAALTMWHQWTWREGGKLAYCCKTECMDNNMRAHDPSAVLGGTKCIRRLCTQPYFQVLGNCEKVACSCCTKPPDNCLLLLKAHLVLWPSFVACTACWRFCSMKLLKSVGCRISSSLYGKPWKLIGSRFCTNAYCISRLKAVIARSVSRPTDAKQMHVATTKTRWLCKGYYCAITSCQYSHMHRNSMSVIRSMRDWNPMYICLFASTYLRYVWLSNMNSSLRQQVHDDSSGRERQGCWGGMHTGREGWPNKRGNYWPSDLVSAVITDLVNAVITDLVNAVFTGQVNAVSTDNCDGCWPTKCGEYWPVNAVITDLVNAVVTDLVNASLIIHHTSLLFTSIASQCDLLLFLVHVAIPFVMAFAHSCEPSLSQGQVCSAKRQGNSSTQCKCISWWCSCQGIFGIAFCLWHAVWRCGLALPEYLQARSHHFVANPAETSLNHGLTMFYWTRNQQHVESTSGGA